MSLSSATVEEGAQYSSKNLRLPGELCGLDVYSAVYYIYVISALRTSFPYHESTRVLLFTRMRDFVRMRWNSEANQSTAIFSQCGTIRTSTIISTVIYLMLINFRIPTRECNLVLLT